tara:strand:+ start:615 stop:929 length:315 start_codon:yes stop_codon:yes gene_type:complete
MKEYNGHRSWNAWNVSLWLGGDEYYYEKASDKIKHVKKHWSRNILSGEVLSKEKQVEIATSLLYKGLNGDHYHPKMILNKTPDGAYFNRLSIKLFIEDMFDQID